MAPTTRLGKKRWLHGLQGSPSLPKRTRTKRITEPFRLMDLPTEIRMMILRELLLLDQPIFFSNKSDMYLSKKGVRLHATRAGDDPKAQRQLYPEILVACKQLKEEGTHFLYDNTIGVRITEAPLFREDMMFTPRSARFKLDILGPRHYGSLAQMPWKASERFSKVHIAVTAKKTPLNRSERIDEQASLQHGMVTLHRLIEAHPQWTQLIIEVSGWPSACHDSLDSDDDMNGADDFMPEGMDRFLSKHPLRMLLCMRDRQVSCTGLEPGFASRVIRTTKLSGPSINLPGMMEALESIQELTAAADDDEGDYDEAQMEMLDAINESYGICFRSMLCADVEHFLRTRDLLLQRVGAFWQFQYRSFFEKDPVGSNEKTRLYGHVFKPDHNLSQVFRGHVDDFNLTEESAPMVNTTGQPIVSIADSLARLT